MKKLGIVALVIGLYVAFEAFFNWGSWNYKLTIAIETPEGIKTGSAVREVYAYREPLIFQFLPSSTYGHAGVKGEAVVIDLGERGVLFALLRGKDSVDYGYRIIFNEFPSDLGGTTSSGIRYYRSLEAKKNLSFDKLPMLVRFRDINDPKTVELVDPNDLTASFGEGVKLVSATIEITDEPVTTGVEKYISKASWKEHGYAEWRANLRYDQIIFDWEDFERK